MISPIKSFILSCSILSPSYNEPIYFLTGDYSTEAHEYLKSLNLQDNDPLTDILYETIMQDDFLNN
jgi:hypothetical protein